MIDASVFRHLKLPSIVSSQMRSLIGNKVGRVDESLHLCRAAEIPTFVIRYDCLTIHTSTSDLDSDRIA